MPIIISNIKLPFTAPKEEAISKALSRLGISNAKEASISRRAVDARRGNLSFVYSVRIALEVNEEQLAERLGDSQIRYLGEETYCLPAIGREPLRERPVVAGFGPAGIFAGLLLARNGYRPIILERGADVDTRLEKVEHFWKTGLLDTECNVQFGEGGAGTFSDGKLTTRISDSRCRFILEELAAHGAPEEILSEAKPHIGTDRLRAVVKSIRKEIISLGGELRFNTRLDSLILNGGKLERILTSTGELPAEALLLALGHSARDSFSMLRDAGIPLEAKPFSVGVRIEHLQSEIDRALYGNHAGNPLLPAGEYQLSHRDNGEDGRAVYTFCMCPGGIVIPAASEAEALVTNGMSEYSRNQKNANSALVVSVDSHKLGGPFDALDFQRKLEKAAYIAGGGGYLAPYETVGSFMGTKTANIAKVEPNYCLGVTEAKLSALFPDEISTMLKEGISRFGKKIRGFDHPGAALTGVESRTSSPVRILRGEDMQSLGAEGLYPCGEGAGYAGGIVSAAVDGLKSAEALMSRYRPFC